MRLRGASRPAPLDADGASDSGRLTTLSGATSEGGAVGGLWPKWLPAGETGSVAPVFVEYRIEGWCPATNGSWESVKGATVPAGMR